MKEIKDCGIIDCFVKTPEILAFNHLQKNLPFPCFYHFVGQLELDTLDTQSHSSYIILGSASHITEKLIWHKRLAEFIHSKLKQNIPVLGICFGHQLMCDYFGCEVNYSNIEEIKATGPRKIIMNTNMVNDFNPTYTHWVSHSQKVHKLSTEMIQIGQSHHQLHGENLYDVVIHSQLPFIGTQLHPEMDLLNSKRVDREGHEISKQELNQIQNEGLDFIEHSFNYLIKNYLIKSDK